MSRIHLHDVVDRAGLLDRFFWLRARLGERSLTVLTYHRIGRPADAGELDRGVFEATAAELADQLTVLAERCTLVSIADVRRSCDGKRLPPHAVLVTFDDGYTDSLDLAVPILRKAGVPATFFIPTAFPDGHKLFWWDRVALLMRRCRRDPVVIAYPERLVLRPSRSPEAAARLVCQSVKRARRIDLDRLWGEIEACAAVSLDAAEERALAARSILGWAAIKKLHDAGMDVQSHAHAHLVLNSLAPAEAQRDLEKSAALLRDALGAAPYAVAYPVGYQLDGEHRAAVSAAGFSIGFTNGTGRAVKRGFDPLNVPRVSLDLGLSRATFKVRVLYGDGRWSRPTWPPPARYFG